MEDNVNERLYKIGDIVRVNFILTSDQLDGETSFWGSLSGGQDTAIELFSDEVSLISAVDAVPDTEAFARKVRYRTDKIASLLIAKNEAYGDSALNPVRVFSKAEPVEQIKVRIDDKISRLQRGTDSGEDTVTDLIGYLILLQIAEDSGGSSVPTHSES